MALTDESNGTGMYMPVAPIGGYYSDTEFFLFALLIRNLRYSLTFMLFA